MKSVKYKLISEEIFKHNIEHRMCGQETSQGGDVKEMFKDSEDKMDSIQREKLGIFHFNNRHYQEAIDCYVQVLSLVQEQEDRDGEMTLQKRLGDAYFSLKEYAKAITYYEKALKIFSELPPHKNSEEVSLQECLGDTYVRTKMHTEAISCYNIAVKNAEELDEKSDVVRLNCKLGDHHFKNANYVAAERYYQKAGNTAKEIDDKYATSRLLVGAGNACFNSRKYGHAITLYQESLNVAQEQCDQKQESLILEILGDSHIKVEQFSRSIEYFEYALKIHQEFKDSRETRRIQAKLRNVKLSAEAISCLNESRTISEKLNEKSHEEILALICLGNAYSDLGLYEKATEFFEECLKISLSLGNRKEEGIAYGRLAAVYYCREQYKKSVESNLKALEISRECMCQSLQREAFKLFGCLYRNFNNYEKPVQRLLVQFRNAERAKKEKESMNRRKSRSGDEDQNTSTIYKPEGGRSSRGGSIGGVGDKYNEAKSNERGNGNCDDNGCIGYQGAGGRDGTFGSDGCCSSNSSSETANNCRGDKSGGGSAGNDSSAANGDSSSGCGGGGNGDGNVSASSGEGGSDGGSGGSGEDNGGGSGGSNGAGGHSGGGSGDGNSGDSNDGCGGNDNDTTNSDDEDSINESSSDTSGDDGDNGGRSDGCFGICSSSGHVHGGDSAGDHGTSSFSGVDRDHCYGDDRGDIGDEGNEDGRRGYDRTSNEDSRNNLSPNELIKLECTSLCESLLNIKACEIYDVFSNKLIPNEWNEIHKDLMKALLSLKQKKTALIICDIGKVTALQMRIRSHPDPTCDDIINRKHIEWVKKISKDPCSPNNEEILDQLCMSINASVEEGSKTVLAYAFDNNHALHTFVLSKKGVFHKMSCQKYEQLEENLKKALQELGPSGPPTGNVETPTDSYYHLQNNLMSTTSQSSTSAPEIFMNPTGYNAKGHSCNPSEHDENSDSILATLYSNLIFPIQEHLCGTKLVIVPQDKLYMLPFTSLRSPKNKKLLVEQFSIQMTPALHLLDPEMPSCSHALFVGDPNGDLQHARKEVEECCKFFNSKPLLQEHANKENVLKDMRKATVIHIATHGESSSNNVALRLSGSDRLCPQDIRKMRPLRARLVVLSSCHSARDCRSNDEVLGIMESFLAAGARSVLAAYCKIEDKSTLALIKLFYDHVARYKSVCVALKESIVQLLKEDCDFSSLMQFAIWGEDFAFTEDDFHTISVQSSLRSPTLSDNDQQTTTNLKHYDEDHSGEFHESLGKQFYNCGDVEKAREHFKKAIEIFKAEGNQKKIASLKIALAKAVMALKGVKEFEEKNIISLND